MFCYQCEQTAGGKGCTKLGVCGKGPETAALQDALLRVTEGTAQHAHRARKLDHRDIAIDRSVLEALFTTVTNVNFDPERVLALIRRGLDLRDKARRLHERAASKAGKPAERVCGPAAWDPPAEKESLLKASRELGVDARRASAGDDATGLQELLTYGLKGMAAYAHHAMILGIESDEVYAFFHEALSFLADDPKDIGELLKWNLKCGEVNLKVMGLLDAANTGAYGHPAPTKVRVEPVKGKAILVSGHDLKDLEELLKQTEGSGVNVYTHGEMLPAHGYPGLKRYKHLVGNYGGAWQDQQKEFAKFPGAILMTTNCIQKPADSYKGRIFTSGLTAWPGVAHVKDRDFAPVISAALAAEGFAQDGREASRLAGQSLPPSDGNGTSIMVGFGRRAVLSVADKVIDAVKGKKIRHFFLIGGCDGAKPGRNYYTDLALAVPKDCVILTLACGKYRFNKLDFGDIGGIPRLLDVGQCNDAYSAIQIAMALAGAFKCGVNDLPLSLILSWYEQKAVCILLTLLHLGIRNIRLGPSLPAFVTPAALKVLVDKFAIAPVSAPAKDLEAILGAKAAA
ncbi:MAG: hydroxylamine reductase [Elusimicrobia bacterium]|nr:hydroxylamine reductase [Elusimicrobiota bacterium]